MASSKGKQRLLEVHETAIDVGSEIGTMLSDFQGTFPLTIEFLDKGNVVDIAIGIVMGSAFTAVVSSFVGVPSFSSRI